MPAGRRYAVAWAETASLDLGQIADYVAHDSADEAERIVDEIERAASSLALFPKRCRIVPELREHGLLLYRERVHAPWRVLFRIEGRAVLVLAVLDGRRNLEDLLLERFLR